MHRRYLRHIWRDFFIIVGGVAFAILLVNLGILEKFLETTKDAQIFTAFLSGMFFTSILTLAPASVALIAVGGSMPALEVALYGACGAVVIDYVLFNFIRNDVERDIEGIMKPKLRRHIVSLFHFGFLKWIIIIAGIFFVATPLPDEFGLVLLGLSNIKHKYLVPITFAGHFAGIWALVSVTNAIL